MYDSFHPLLIPTYGNISVYYEKVDSNTRSLQYQKKALNIAEHNDKNTENLAAMYSNYGMALADNNNFKKSIEYNQKSIDIRKQKLNTIENANLAYSYNSMSYTYRRMKEYDKALDYHKKTIEVSKKYFGSNNIYTGIFYHKMAESYEGKEEFSKALEILQKVELIYQKTNWQGSSIVH